MHSSEIKMYKKWNVRKHFNTFESLEHDITKTSLRKSYVNARTSSQITKKKLKKQCANCSMVTNEVNRNKGKNN